MVITIKQIKQLKSLQPELRTIRKYLTHVKEKQGFFPLVRFKNKGLIKKHIFKKGVKRGGVFVGEKSRWVLTSKGKTMLRSLNSLL